jgi:hypothetical protein
MLGRSFSAICFLPFAETSARPGIASPNNGIKSPKCGLVSFIVFFFLIYQDFVVADTIFCKNGKKVIIGCAIGHINYGKLSSVLLFRMPEKKDCLTLPTLMAQIIAEYLFFEGDSHIRPSTYFGRYSSFFNRQGLISLT